MIIVNQSKELILNFDNIIGIQVNGNDICLKVVDSDSVCIGEYKTNERAKEVLQEIVCAVNSIYKTYEMPAE